MTFMAILLLLQAFPNVIWYSGASIDKISTDKARPAFFLRQLSFLFDVVYSIQSAHFFIKNNTRRKKRFLPLNVVRRLVRPKQTHTPRKSSFRPTQLTF